MEEHGVVPYVIDNVPAQLLQVVYPSGVTVKLGNKLTVTQVKDAPTVTWTADTGALYTLVMTDAGPQNNEQPEPKEELKHWLVVNIPGSQLDQGDCVVGYRGSGPPRTPALRRYIFLLYKQPGKIQFDEPRVGSSEREGRRNFSARKFTAKYGLGDPVAGCFYLAKKDE